MADTDSNTSTSRRDADPAIVHRTEDSVLGNARITTEPLKSNLSEETKSNSPTSVFWMIEGLFGKRKSSDENDDSSSAHDEKEDSPSLSMSVSSENDANSADALSVTDTGASRKLKFNEQVEVCLIPKKEEYSKRVRVHLWNSPEEMAANAHRNTVEFAAEGWDWRNVMEDENMYRCLATNELIHPVHIEQPST